MKILILDDDSVRQREFSRRLIGEDVAHTFTAKETIDQLKLNIYDILFLDHDLGGKINVTSGEGTRFEVAEWIKENPDRKPHHIIIHSYNPIGAKNMQQCLPGSVLCPGIWLKL